MRIDNALKKEEKEQKKNEKTTKRVASAKRVAAFEDKLLVEDSAINSTRPDILVAKKDLLVVSNEFPPDQSWDEFAAQGDHEVEESVEHALSPGASDYPVTSAIDTGSEGAFDDGGGDGGDDESSGSEYAGSADDNEGEQEDDDLESVHAAGNVVSDDGMVVDKKEDPEWKEFQAYKKQQLKKKEKQEVRPSIHLIYMLTTYVEQDLHPEKHHGGESQGARETRQQCRK